MILGQGQADGRLGQHPGRVHDGHAEIAILEDERDLGAARADDFGSAQDEVLRRLPDQTAWGFGGIPTLDCIDCLHDEAGLHLGIGGQDGEASRSEVGLEQTALHRAARGQEAEPADLGAFGREGRCGLPDNMQDGDRYGPLQPIVEMVGRDAGDDKKSGAGLDEHLGAGHQGRQWIGTFALDSGRAVGNLGVTIGP